MKEFGRHHAPDMGFVPYGKSQVAANPLPLAFPCGVYFLLRGDRIVYVGQSDNVYARVSQHLKDKLFDGWSFVTVSPKSLDVVESFYILQFSPEYNFARHSISGKRLLRTPISKHAIDEALLLLEREGVLDARVASAWRVATSGRRSQKTIDRFEALLL